MGVVHFSSTSTVSYYSDTVPARRITNTAQHRTKRDHRAVRNLIPKPKNQINWVKCR
jgi:hypothetical protein